MFAGASSLAAACHVVHVVFSLCEQCENLAFIF